MINWKVKVQKCKENFYKAKSKPRSKRESFVLGVITTVSIFGVTLLASVLPAVAKDVPKNIPTPGEVCPVPSSNPQPALVPSQEILKGFSGTAAAICALAVSSGSFLVGAACGLVVVLGILKAQGK